MRATPLVQLFWKEYRAQRALWLSMLGIALLLQLWVLGILGPGPDGINVLFGVALAWPAFYAMGCGAMLFAAEHDDGTYEFQRCLPVTAGQLLAGKIIFAVLSLAAMAALTLLASWGFARGRVPDLQMGLGLWGLWGVAGVEMLAWAVLFSLLSRRVIPAAIFSVAAASLSIQFCVAVLNEAEPNRFWETSAYLHALPMRLVILLLVVLADWVLGLRWLQTRSGDRGVWAALRQEAEYPRWEKIARWKVRRRGWGLAHLVWQHWRQSWRLMATVALASLLVGLIFVWGMRGDVLHNLVALIVALLGACVFVPDQRGNRFRFFAEQGVRPSLVWLSRQLVWALPIVLVVLGISLVGVVEQQRAMGITWEVFRWKWVIWEALWGIGMALGFVLLVYGAGQLCSMFFRSSILAAVFGLVLGELMAAWAGLVLELGLPWFQVVWPLAVLLLVATWLRTPDWLLQRNTWTAWGKIGGLLAVGLAVVLAVAVYHRVADIPWSEPGFDVAEFTRPRTPAEQETLELYQKAWNLDSKPEKIELMLQASQRSEANFFRVPEAEHFRTLGLAVLENGRSLQSQGKSQEAAERYLVAVRIAWQLRQHTRFYGEDPWEAGACQALLSLAGDKKLSAQELTALIARVEKVFEETPFSADPIKVEYLEKCEYMASDLGGYSRKGPQFLLNRWLVHHLMPWETVRAQRVLNTFSTQAFQELAEVERAVAAGEAVSKEAGPGAKRWDHPLMVQYQTTPLLWGRHWWNDTPVQYVQRETQRRVVLVGLALAAWKAEHGELPPTLESLIGPYLKRMPLDPVSGQPFEYHREGLPQEVMVDAAWNRRLEGSSFERVTPQPNTGQVYRVPAGTPLLLVHGASPQASSGKPDTLGLVLP